MGKKTIVLGASPNTARYSYTACRMLHASEHEFIPVSIRRGKIFGREILNIRDQPVIQDVDTITIYMNSVHQSEWYDYIMKLHPRRIIFNPGAENPELSKIAEKAGIVTENSCTLVLLSTGSF